MQVEISAIEIEGDDMLTVVDWNGGAHMLYSGRKSVILDIQEGAVISLLPPIALAPMALSPDVPENDPNPHGDAGAVDTTALDNPTPVPDNPGA